MEPSARAPSSLIALGRTPPTEAIRYLSPIATRAERKAAHITGESITGYFRERLAERARGEATDAISALAREAARGELINTTEAADMLGVIIVVCHFLPLEPHGI